jgi:hypothetical protein
MKHEYIVARFELNGTLEMRFVHFAVDFRALKFHSFGIHETAGATAANGYNPGKADVYQQPRR